MKIIIQKEDLLYAVSAVERAVSNKNTLPVLGGILIEATAERVCFRATDLELAMECVVQAEIVEAGQAVVPGRKFSALTRLLPGGSISLSSNGDIMEIEYGLGKQSLLCYPAEEFPVMPECEEGVRGSISVRSFRRLVKEVGIAAAADEVRPVFSGVYTEFHEQEMVMVATDTHRLAYGKVPFSGSGQTTLLIPNRTLQEAARLAVNEDDQIILTAGKNQIYFSYANLTFISRLIVGQYPDYHQVIPEPDSYQATLVIDKKAFSEVLERAALISRDSRLSRSNTVRLSVDGPSLFIAAEVQDEGMIREEIAISASGVEEMEVHFNARYLLDVLKVIEEERIVFQLTGPSTPGVIVPDQGGEAAESDYLYLLLPIRISR